MNVYLGIDGVLLINETHAANYADNFLQAILEKYPDSTYWLTTYDRTGDNRAKEVLAPYLKPGTVQLLHKIKPTKWDELKTDAINFEDDFLWFGSSLLTDELKVLEEHEAAEQFILVKLDEDPDMLKKLTDAIKATAQPQ